MSPRKIAIVVGTRPNFIKITQFEKAFKQYPGAFDYQLIHTGQHYDKNMSRVFFEELGLKEPDIYLQVAGQRPAGQIGHIIERLGHFFAEWQPDLAIVVGDVNSTLAGALAANKEGILLAHLESGLRSGDRRMPEEINRLLTDQLTDHFFITEQSGLDHLQREVQHAAGLHFVGNTMIDTLVAFEAHIDRSRVLEKHGLRAKNYMLGTLHRPSNVDHPEPLEEVVSLLEGLAERLPVVLPLHPRTRKQLERHGLWERFSRIGQLRVLPPLGYIDFQRLVKQAALVFTDSGGLQEETTYRRIPCLTIRENTERPVTCTLGTNTLVPLRSRTVEAQVDRILAGSYKEGEVPPLWDGRATERIVEEIRKFLD